MPSSCRTKKKERDPLVSVVMICLNQEKFVKEAIQSVVDQTYTNWELLFVDDGSTDGTTQIAGDIAAKYPGKIRCLEHENHANCGMSESRNLGISHAKGEFVSFLDSDDYWFPHKLEHQLTVFQQYPEAAFVTSPAQYWFSWEGNPENRTRDFVQEFPIPKNRIVAPPDMFKMIVQNRHTTLCDVLVRKSVLEEIGGYENEFTGMHEDMAMHSKLCLHYPGFVTSSCWYRYRQHANSCTNQAYSTTGDTMHRNTYLNWVKNYLSQSGLDLPEAKTLIEYEIWKNQHPKLARYRKNASPRKILAKICKTLLPKRTNAWLTNQLRNKHWPPVGFINFGSLRRLKPMGPIWTHRGTTIDRYYIEKFLAEKSQDIQGHVLEIADSTYTWKFGGDNVTKSSVLHAAYGNPEATIVGEIEDESLIEPNTFDCIILTQTILLIYDIKESIKAVYRLLKPGGVVLITVPGISQIVLEDNDEWPDYWRFTNKSARKLMEEYFPSDHVEVGTYGNVLSATGFLYGIAKEELKQEELDHRDPKFQVTIWVRAQKPVAKS